VVQFDFHKAPIQITFTSLRLSLITLVSSLSAAAWMSPHLPRVTWQELQVTMAFFDPLGIEMS